MHDIFVSYKSSDRERVRPLVALFERQGWSVWWDQKIPAGKTFDEFIEEKINEAKCVVVVWSADSVKSKWVKTEAAEGDRRGILVPVLIDDATIPLAFRQTQAQRIGGVSAEAVAESLSGLLASVAGVISKSPTGVELALAEAVRRVLGRRGPGRVALWAGAGAVAALALVFFAAVPAYDYLFRPANRNGGAPPANANLAAPTATPAPAPPQAEPGDKLYAAYDARKKALRLYLPVTFTREGFIDRMDGRLGSVGEGDDPVLASRTDVPPLSGRALSSPIRVRKEDAELTYSVSFQMSEALGKQLVITNVQKLSVDFRWRDGESYSLAVCFTMDGVEHAAEAVEIINLTRCQS